MHLSIIDGFILHAKHGVTSKWTPILTYFEKHIITNQLNEAEWHINVSEN